MSNGLRSWCGCDGGGDYSKGLEADYDKANPEPGKATGEATEQLSGLRAKAEAVRARIEAARDAAPKGTGDESLLKALKARPMARSPGSRTATSSPPRRRCRTSAPTPKASRPRSKQRSPRAA